MEFINEMKTEAHQMFVKENGKHLNSSLCLMTINGRSMVCLPISVKVNRFPTSAQNKHWLRGHDVILRCFAA